MKKLTCLILVASLLPGCTAQQFAADEAIAKTNVHASSVMLLGVFTAAKNNATLLGYAKGLLVLAVQKAAPKDAEALQGVLDHVNEGNIDAAIALLTVFVSFTAPAGVQ